jgi:hypothetical protein
VDEFGENTRGWLAGVQQEATARPQAPVPVAAKGRRFHLPRLFRKAQPQERSDEGTSLLLAAPPVTAAPPEVAHDRTAHAIDVAARFAARYAQLAPAGNTADEPTWGYVAPDQLDHGARHEPTAAEAAAEEALEWGPWDTDEQRQETRKVLYVPPAAPWKPVPAGWSAEQVARIASPGPDAPRDRLAAYMCQVSAATGTSSPYEQPQAWLSARPGARRGPITTYSLRPLSPLALPAGSEVAA